MKRIRRIVQLLLAVLLAGGFVLCLAAALAGDTKSRGGMMLLRPR